MVSLREKAGDNIRVVIERDGGDNSPCCIEVRVVNGLFERDGGDSMDNSPRYMEVRVVNDPYM